eukprot:TRINITY_DN20472_c0_g1_i1.p1 TRINITY_DN20472_c0_g1~~TRINITY_DN20472_c0_g1_i1.p1  ORF type:complete len:218 (-),score=15.13 TRINITY_DN20472_c0_g1_i1:447-1100(-)
MESCGSRWSEMYGVSIDDASGTLFFSVGTVVYKTPLDRYEKEQICEVSEFTCSKRLGRACGFIMGLAFNPNANEVYVHALNGDMNRRLVTCSVTEKRVSYSLQYADDNDGSTNTKYIVALPGRSPEVGHACSGTCGSLVCSCPPCKCPEGETCTTWTTTPPPTNGTTSGTPKGGSETSTTIDPGDAIASGALAISFRFGHGHAVLASLMLLVLQANG